MELLSCASWTSSAPPIPKQNSTRHPPRNFLERFKKLHNEKRLLFYPRSPYGLAKQYAYWAVVNYREAYNLYACNGILFNHESPRRGENFVSRKVTLGVARIKKGLQEKIALGNLDAKRDWGYAKDFVEGMWMMLQQEKPEDYVLSTGKMISVRELVMRAFQEIDIQIVWQGEGLEEKGLDSRTGKVLVEITEEHFRPSEVGLFDWRCLQS